MRRGKVRRLKAEAQESYDHGYIDGCNAKAKGWGAPLFDLDRRRPAYEAGYTEGFNGTEHAHRVPLDVWVKVLALAEWRNAASAYE